MKNITLSKNAKDRYITYLFLAVFTVAVELYVTLGFASSTFIGWLPYICSYVLAAISLNLVVGISGELSLGQAGFMCVGVYVGSAFSIITQEMIPNSMVRFPIALLLGGVVAAIFGFLISIPVLRLRGDYLAIVTLAFGEIIKSIFGSIYFSVDKNGSFWGLSVEERSNHNFDLETRNHIFEGPDGIKKIPFDFTFIVAMIVIFIAMFIMLNFIDSKHGRAVMASRDNRIAAEAMGVNVTRAKMTAFVMSAFFAGIAGVLYSHGLGMAAPSKFGYNLSIEILIFVVLGGMMKMRSVMIATVFLYVLPELLRDLSIGETSLSEYRMLIYAIILIVMMVFNNSATFKKLRENFSNRFASLKKAPKEETGGKA